MLFVEDITQSSNFVDIEDLKYQLSELQYHLEGYQNSLKEVEYHQKNIRNIHDHLRSLNVGAI